MRDTLPILACLLLLGISAQGQNASFYKEPPLFSTAPDPNKSVEIPVLGAYSKTWPLNCPKSDKIVRNFAEYLKQPKSNKGFADIGMLFQLSTGDDSDLATVSAIVDDTTLAVSADYPTWAGGAAFAADSNNDGVANGLARLLGAANPTARATALLPVPPHEAGKLVLAFRCRKTALRGTSLLKVQYTNHLGQTDLWTSHEALVPDADGPVVSVVFDTTADSDPAFINIRAEIPAGAASPASHLYSTSN